MSCRLTFLVFALMLSFAATAAPTWSVDSLSTIGCGSFDTSFQTTVDGASGSGPERFRTIVEADGLRYMDEDAGIPDNGPYGWSLYDDDTGGPVTASFPLPPDVPVVVDFMFIAGESGPSIFHRRVTLSQCNDGSIVENIVLPPEVIFANGFETSVIACEVDAVIVDGGFEKTVGGGTHPNWSTYSQNFGSPLCTAAACGTGGGAASPASGNWWSWFGGAGGVAEEAWVEQTVILPEHPDLMLEFDLRIGTVGDSGATLDVLVDDNTIATFEEPEEAEADYSLRHVAMGEFADGQEHVLRLQYQTPVGQNSNFSVDDVRLSCGLPPTRSDRPGDEPRLSGGPNGANNRP